MTDRTSRRFRLGIAVSLAALALSACASDGVSDPDPTDTADPASQLVAQAASFDLAVGEDQRLLLGLLRSDNTVIGGGQVDVQLAYLGDGESPTSGEVPVSDTVPAEFLPLPGDEPEVADTPAPIEGSGAGVYEAFVDFDRAGFWGAQVSVDFDGQTHTAQASFEVGEEHRVTDVGDPAPRTEHPTIDSGDAEPITIDSRAQDQDAEIPDPELHDAVITDVLDAGRPMVVVISTPVYCQSQFCGPITDTIADLSDEYGDRAEFVHLEVWRDFQNQELNPYVSEWIADPETGAGGEPWVFLVGADGTVEARWDNVLDEQGLRTMLDELPGA